MFCADSLENLAVHPACRYSGNTRTGSALRSTFDDRQRR